MLFDNLANCSRQLHEKAWRLPLFFFNSQLKDLTVPCNPSTDIRMFNLISDPWIKVLRRSGPDEIRPDQITDPDILRPNWQRSDLDLACYELLIGLVYLACPPNGRRDRLSPPSGTLLRNALASLAPAFNLVGSGPLFLQDLEPLPGRHQPVDMLFLDSAGKSTIEKNADLMVHAKRYPSLDLSTAAMALYTLQSFAPAGGSGNRTSMRGGGPLVALVQPESSGLWPLIWANVPHGKKMEPNELEKLPWMRPTETSENNNVRVESLNSNNHCHPEVFFGQPRRIRLVEKGNRITGVIQCKYGTNYEGWIHPLTPYDRKGSNSELLPVHPPKSEPICYRHWAGLVFQAENHRRPACLTAYLRDCPSSEIRLLVAGWAMDNMKPVNFVWSDQPVFDLPLQTVDRAMNLVQSAEQVARALKDAVAAVFGKQLNLGSCAPSRVFKAFWLTTESEFEVELRKLSLGNDSDQDAMEWLMTMRKVAMQLFDSEVAPGLPDLPLSRVQRAGSARKKLKLLFRGYGTAGRKTFDLLGLKSPSVRKK